MAPDHMYKSKADLMSLGKVWRGSTVGKKQISLKVHESFFSSENKASIKVSAGWITVNIITEKEIQF